MPSLLLIFPGAGMPCGQANSGVGNEAPQQVVWNRQRWGPSGLDTVLETQQSFSGFGKNWSQSKRQVFLEDWKSQMPGPNLSWSLSWRALNLGPQSKGASQTESFKCVLWPVFCSWKRFYLPTNGGGGRVRMGKNVLQIQWKLTLHFNSGPGIKSNYIGNCNYIGNAAHP